MEDTSKVEEIKETTEIINDDNHVYDKSMVLDFNDFILGQWKNIYPFLYCFDIISRFSALYYFILFLSYVIFDWEIRLGQILMIFFLINLAKKLEKLALYSGEREKIIFSNLLKKYRSNKQVSNIELNNFFINYDIILSYLIELEKLYQTKKSDSIKLIIKSLIDKIKNEIQRRILTIL